MKRFHVHLNVDDLSRSIGFYSQLFAAQPARVESDYAKWMLEDPPVNFAISTRGDKPGIDHLGIQTDSTEELAALKARAQAADMALIVCAVVFAGTRRLGHDADVLVVADRFKIAPGHPGQIRAANDLHWFVMSFHDGPP